MAGGEEGKRKHSVDYMGGQGESKGSHELWEKGKAFFCSGKELVSNCRLYQYQVLSNANCEVTAFHNFHQI